MECINEQFRKDNEQMMKLLEEFKDTQQLRDALAKQLGNDIIV